MPASMRRVTSIRWNVLFLLFVASFVAYVLRTNLSIAGEQMMTDLRLSKVQLGMVLAAFAWGYALFQFPGGVLGDLIGARRGLALVAASWGVMNLLIGLVPSRSVASAGLILGVLIALRFLMGVAQAPLYPYHRREYLQLVSRIGLGLPQRSDQRGLDSRLRRDGPAHRLADGDRRMAAVVRPDGAPRLRHRLRLVVVCA